MKYLIWYIPIRILKNGTLSKQQTYYPTYVCRWHYSLCNFTAAGCSGKWKLEKLIMQLPQGRLWPRGLPVPVPLPLPAYILARPKRRSSHTWSDFTAIAHLQPSLSYVIVSVSFRPSVLLLQFWGMPLDTCLGGVACRWFFATFLEVKLQVGSVRGGAFNLRARCGTSR